MEMEMAPAMAMPLLDEFEEEERKEEEEY